MKAILKAVDVHKTWVSAAPVLFMEVIAIFEQLYFQPVKQIAYCHVRILSELYTWLQPGSSPLISHFYVDPSH